MPRFKFNEQTVLLPRTVNYSRPSYHYAGQRYKAGEKSLVHNMTLALASRCECSDCYHSHYNVLCVS